MARRKTPGQPFSNDQIMKKNREKKNPKDSNIFTPAAFRDKASPDYDSPQIMRK